MKFSATFQALTLLGFTAANSVSAAESRIRGSAKAFDRKLKKDDSEDEGIFSAEEMFIDASACATDVQRQAGGCNIVETAIAAETFTTLVDLVATAGLVETLQSPGPFTVFAPLDSAFPTGDDLEAFKESTDMDTLTSILTFHVVPGTIMASDLSEGGTVTTVQGTNLTFSLMNGPMVNNANIVTADIMTSNGVIHVIDTVLDPTAPTMDIVETAIAAGNFSTLVDLVATAGLVETLQSPGPFTVFAPLDSAFPSGVALEEFKNSTDMATLTSILTYHVVPGKVMSSALAEGLTVATVQGTNITFSLMDGAMVNDANIVAADIETTNGVIHIIDTILMPTASSEDAEMATPDQPISAEMDIVDTAVSAGSFTILADLLIQTGLITTLQGEGPFTVFAPTDAAFGDEEEVAAIRALPAPTLAQILTYHVVSGQVMASDLSDGQQVSSVFGESFTVGIDDGAVTVDDANVVQTDIMATNGVIHVIDSVMIPDAVILP